uniref:Protein kinase domain-containing protein n=1 Tax=Kalanchoe fedtschenkoi TaxID=63787 RepID=A0A7N0V0F5_KALFE
MGCFTVSKSKKKKQASFVNRLEHIDHSPIVLPEPKIQARSLQSAPSSFRTRVKPVQPVSRTENSRTRALSAPSSFNDQDTLASAESDHHEEMKSRGGSQKEQRPPSSQPLPLPSPHVSGSLKKLESFKSGTTVSGPLCASGPLPLPPLTTIRHFSFEEISAACHGFYPDRCMLEGVSSTLYKASFGEESSSSRKIEATVSRLHSSTQSLKDFVSEVNTLASLQHPNLCKLLGYHARDGSENRILVYERLSHGSLDNLLYGRSGGPPLDWNARMKVALCAAQGLAFLHEEGPFQAMYTEFSTVNIQIDKDFSGKLSGYGCVGHIPEAEISNGSVASLPLETLDRGLLTPKSNVWSFGIVLLELATGRKNLDSRHPKEEMNLVKWSRPFLSDDHRLTLIMDPQLKGRYPTKAGRTVADLIQRCLQKDPSERPTMRIIVEGLKTIQDIKYPARYPLQEPGIGFGKKQIARSPSLNVIVMPAPKANLSPSPPSRTQYAASYTHLSAPLQMSPPPRACSSLSLDELDRQESGKSSTTFGRRTSVEGF